MTHKLQASLQARIRFAGLLSLNLSHNALGSAAGSILAPALAQGLPSLQALSLKGTSMPDEAGAAVAQLLLPSAAIRLARLDLACNPSISIATCQKLARAMQYNESLVELDLSKNQLGARSGQPWHLVMRLGALIHCQGVRMCACL
jgi:Ran GTPase-activating protein (RanGAP) involved in mRNA processing and transport